eukprot:jgi/Chrzof1/1631/Cz10g15030.t1
MTAMAKRAPVGYMAVKLKCAVEECLAELGSWRSSHSNSSFKEALSQAAAKFTETYNKQLTSAIAITGTAMAPSLNKDGLTDKTSAEKLVMRLIPRPSSKTVSVGDVVAFKSPLDHARKHVMVRRVAALEREWMESSSPDQDFQIPLGHCWVLADNPDLEPPEVVDSRVFGHIPMDSILGRIIYRVKSAEQHGPVLNSARALAEDMAVIQHEVDLEQLTAGLPKQ